MTTPDRRTPRTDRGDFDFGKQRLHVRRRHYRGSFALPKNKDRTRQPEGARAASK
jgi:hypothetical protein